MQPYTSRTGTRSTLALLREHGYRLLVSAAADLRSEGFRYAIDNGAWPAHCQGRDMLDLGRYRKAVDKLGDGADWVVLPDIVGAGERSLALSLEWLDWTSSRTRLPLIAVQDGMTPSDIAPLIGGGIGIFLGGSTDWKLQTCLMWGRLADEFGSYLHVGRVNTKNRIQLCASSGAASFDGTSPIMFPSAKVALIAKWTAETPRQGGACVCSHLI